MDHKNVLLAIKKCEADLGTQLKFGMRKNLIENN